MRACTEHAEVYESPRWSQDCESRVRVRKNGSVWSSRHHTSDDISAKEIMNHD